MLKGVIFDLDGVLVDTELYQWQGWVEALQPYGIELSKEDYISRYAGKTAAFIESELLQRHHLDAPDVLLSEKKEELLLQWFTEKKIALMPYARESVEFFLDRNMKVAIVSGGPGKEVELKLKKAGLFPLFKTILSRDDVRRGKPSPDIYLLGLRRLGLKSHECVVFEDTQFGVEAASAAGIMCLAIPNEFCKNQEFSKAEKTFNGLKDAIDWVKKHHL